MLRQSSSSAPPLDYLRPSPVRGQLEPYDPRTAKGWRYIQTTDTLNQLKVLLPPGTASMYEQLLKFEAFELGKKSTLSWERILEIRHLKDRMIRKCQKLAKSSPSKKTPEAFAFQTFIAPSDFRVKEMEKWFQQQQARTNASLKRPLIRDGGGNTDCCPRCSERAVGKDSMLSRLHDPHLPASNQASQLLKSHKRFPIYHEGQILADVPLRGEKSSTLSTRVQPVAALPAQPPPRFLPSPPPLPHLLRVRDLSTGFDLSDDPQKLISLPSDAPEKDANGSTNDDVPPTPPGQEILTQTGELLRRRSCIKRSSIGDFVKTVSWADNQELADQVSKHASIAREAEASDRKWEEIRDIYLEQMTGLESIHQQVEQNLEHLRSETEHLKRVDEMIFRQREALRSTFQDLENKQLVLQAKVKEALKDADRVLSLSGHTVNDPSAE